jgi:hypothetical protein
LADEGAQCLTALPAALACFPSVPSDHGDEAPFWLDVVFDIAMQQIPGLRLRTDKHTWFQELCVGFTAETWPVQRESLERTLETELLLPACMTDEEKTDHRKWTEHLRDLNRKLLALAPPEGPGHWFAELPDITVASVHACDYLLSLIDEGKPSSPHAEDISLSRDQHAPVWTIRKEGKTMAATSSSAPRIRTLHETALECLELMAQLAGTTVKASDPEPAALGELRRVVEQLPPMDEDPFTPSNLADLPPGGDGTIWHDWVRCRAVDWAPRLSANLAELEWRRLGQSQVMPLLAPPSEVIRAYLLVEMKRVEERQAQEAAAPHNQDKTGQGEGAGTPTASPSPLNAPAFIWGEPQNTTPPYPEPPLSVVESAQREIPEMLAEIPHFIVPASGLAYNVRDRGHSIAAAAWGIHYLITDGRLEVGFLQGTELDSFRSLYLFHGLAIRATPKLWQWWKAGMGNVGGNGTGKVPGEGGDEPEGTKAGRRGRKPHFDSRKDEEVAENWKRAKAAGVTKKDFASDQRLSLRALTRILDRHAKRIARE